MNSRVALRHYRCMSDDAAFYHSLSLALPERNTGQRSRAQHIAAAAWKAADAYRDLYLSLLILERES